MDTITRQLSDARLSRVVTHNGIVYLAGLTADTLVEIMVVAAQS